MNNFVSISSKRAKKDKYTREKAIEKIQSKISKNITKSDLKLSYYAKYLDIDNTLDEPTAQPPNLNNFNF